MDDNARDLQVEDRLRRLGVSWHWEDAVSLDQIVNDQNPARWQERYDPNHSTSIACSMIDHKPVPAFLLYRPPGATRYRRLGGTHRFEACREAKLAQWPGYVIDQPLDEFLIEALPIYDNVDHGRGYTREQRLAFAADLLKFDDRKPDIIARELQLTMKEVNHYVDMLAVKNRVFDLHISADAKRVDERLQVEAHKLLPNDNIFKAVIETLAFTEMTGNAGRGLIKDAHDAKSEAAALARLKQVYEKHRIDMERRRRGGRKRAPTRLSRYKKHALALESTWPGSLALMDVQSHEDDFLSDLLGTLRTNIPRMQEVADRCVEVLTMRETSRAERAATLHGKDSSATASPPM